MGYGREVAMRAFVFMLAVLVSVPITAQAQVKPELRPFVGAFIPTGTQRDVFKDAVLTGGQLALEMNDRIHLVGTFAFSGPSFKSQVTGSDHMHIYQTDVGAELFQSVSLQNEWEFRPFVGLGGGVRTFDPAGSIASKSYPSGYAAIGTEFQLDRFALRFETRDYLMSFKGVSGTEKSSTRNEIAISAGLAYHLR
jgi:hypothetical protein